MRKILILASLLMALLPTVAVPPASPSSQVRQAIQAAYNAGNAAAARSDVDGLLKFLHSDFVFTDAQGKTYDRKAMASRLGTFIRRSRNYRAVTTVQKVTLRGGGAFVTVHDHIDVTLVQMITGWVSHRIIDETRQDFWVKTDQGWKDKQSNVLSEVDDRQ